MRRKPFNRMKSSAASREPEIDLEPGPTLQPDEDGNVALPIHAVKWMSDERWKELSSAQAEGFKIMKRAIATVRAILTKASFSSVESELLLAIKIARWQESDGKEQRINLDLDRRCSALLRRFQQKEPGIILPDVVNGALARLLEATLENRLITMGEAVKEAAKRRREGR
jgi:hypothetical protein